MKKILLLIPFTLIVGCSNFSPRKDLSKNITFENSIIKKGEYNFTLISLNYPGNYSDKVKFFNTLNDTLVNLDPYRKSNLNLIISPDLEKDINALLETGWIGKESLVMKNAADLDKTEKIFLDSLNIKTPENSGNIQKYLNLQYYFLLKLNNSENLYNSNVLYTEYDKSLFAENLIIKRKNLIDNLKSIKKNFVYESKNKFNTQDIIFTQNDSNLSNPVIFVDSNKFSGFTLDNDSLIVSTNSNHEFLSTKNYIFTSQIANLTSPNEIIHYSFKKNSIGVSNLNIWERIVKENSRDENISLENNFLKLEDN